MVGRQTRYEEDPFMSKTATERKTNEEAELAKRVIRWGTYACLAIVLLLCLCLYGCPQYSVYSSRMDGEAELAKAEYSKKVLVQTAQAKLDAASLEAQAEIAHAHGIQQANKIIADGLGGPEGYLRWKYIEMLSETSNNPAHTVIYVPNNWTQMPISEAGRATGLK